MEYRLGTSIRIQSTGETSELNCPHCGNKVQFGVFSNNEFRLAPNFPLYSLTTVYFLVCPECASVFTVDSQKGKQLKKGDTLAINDEDLTELKEFKPVI